MEFSKQEYWNGLPFPSPEDLSDPGIEPNSSALQADYLLFELQGRLDVYIYKADFITTSFTGTERQQDC